MLRHDHVPFQALNERITEEQTGAQSQRRDTFAIASCKSDEVQWVTDVDQIRPMRTVLDHSRNCRGSRVGCNSHAIRVPLQRFPR